MFRLEHPLDELYGHKPGESIAARLLHDPEGYLDEPLLLYEPLEDLGVGLALALSAVEEELPAGRLLDLVDRGLAYVLNEFEDVLQLDSELLAELIGTQEEEKVLQQGAADDVLDLPLLRVALEVVQRLPVKV